jgi:hypothetical protein
MKVEEQFRFAFLDKWIYLVDMFCFITKLILSLNVRRGGCGNYCGCLQFLNPRGTSAPIANMCVDMCTWSKSTRSKLCSEVSYIGEL